jgi:CopG family nickel-responsive transcriptional regulator
MGLLIFGRSDPKKEQADMSSLIRTAISLDRELLQEFDRIIEQKGYGSRSEAIRDLVRDLSVKSDVASNSVIVATLTLVYDHHQPKLSEQLIEAQHHYAGKVLATTHVHLDARNCLEVIILKGRGSEIQHFADHLLSLRGVKHGKLVMTTTHPSPPGAKRRHEHFADDQR